MYYLPAFALSLSKYTLCNPLENTSQRDAFDILLSALDLNSTVQLKLSISYVLMNETLYLEMANQ